MAGRDVLHLEGVLERRHSLRNGVIRRGEEVEPAGDQVDFGIDGRRRLNDLVDPRVRAAHHKHEAVRGVDGHRQLFKFLGAGGFGHERNQRDAGSDLGRLVDKLEVGALPRGAEFHDLRRLAVVVAHLRRQGFLLAVEARW